MMNYITISQECAEGKHDKCPDNFMASDHYQPGECDCACHGGWFSEDIRHIIEASIKVKVKRAQQGSEIGAITCLYSDEIGAVVREY